MGEGLEGVSADAPASQTLSVLSSEPETMVLPSGEKATDSTQSLCALCFSTLSSREAAAGRGAISFGLRVGGVRVHTPASQTLSVLSSDPETMVLPSGEKATERTTSLCALCFSALSFREAATSTGVVRSGLRVGGCQC